MKIVTHQTDDKESVLSDILLNSKEPDKTVFVIFKTTKELLRVFRVLRDSNKFTNFKFKEYHKETSNCSYIVYFIRSYRDNFQGLRCDVAVLFDELDSNMQQFISSKIKGNSSLEKSMHVIKKFAMCTVKENYVV